MKRLIYTLTIILIPCFSFSQEVQNSNVFQVVETGSKYTSEALITALSQADWCGFYYSSERHVLKFDDGSVAELLSFSELKGLGISMPQGCEMANGGVDEAIYSIANNGFIVRTANKKITK
jgi:hypothetical protein